MKNEDDTDCAVLAYLAAHPSAADTLEKITEWWLERRRIRTGVEVVSASLARLVVGGAVETFERTDGETLFRLTNTNSRAS